MNFKFWRVPRLWQIQLVKYASYYDATYPFFSFQLHLTLLPKTNVEVLGNYSSREEGGGGLPKTHVEVLGNYSSREEGGGG